jgi:hypothetical protein
MNMEMLIKIAEILITIYYQFTKFYPRRIPITNHQYYQMKTALISLGVEDTPENWYTIASHIQSINILKIRVKYSELVNVIIRFKTNKLAQEQKKIAGTLINAKLEAEI